MIDLEEVSGLPVKFDQEKNSLIFGGGVKEVRPVRRLLEEIKEVLLDKSVTSPEEFYYMYRDVYKEEDEKIIRANISLRQASLSGTVLACRYFSSASR